MPTDPDATRLARRRLLGVGAALALAAAGAGLYVAVPAVCTAGWANVRVIEERETPFGHLKVVEVGPPALESIDAATLSLYAATPVAV